MEWFIDMIKKLRDKIASYITRNCDITCWRSIRQNYAYYSYLAFMCLVVNELNADCRTENICNIIRYYGIEEENILQFIMSIRDAETFIDEILELAKEYKNVDVNGLYQEYLAKDFLLCGESVTFEGGKNNRDVLGSYYTQENFAYEITRKAIDDYFFHNQLKDRKIRIADYSCGGGAFLLSAYKLCCEKKIPVSIYGYDVDPIAVLITRFRLVSETKSKQYDANISLGNPLIRNEDNRDSLGLFKLAAAGEFYNSGMGIIAEDNMDVVIGNPPWEKIRFEEKKFLHHFTLNTEVGTRSERENYLFYSLKENKDYYNDIAADYEMTKTKIKADSYFNQSNCGELNTYALFTELSINSLSDKGVAGLIIKSSLVRMPVYSKFFKRITKNKILYELYMFVNRKKIFNIDSREEFSVIYLRKGNNTNLKLALNLDDYTDFTSKDKIELPYELLSTLNPNTGMVPNISCSKELEFLMTIYKNNRTFSEVYPFCKFGRLVHLTNHSESIKKYTESNYDPIYEGKFIEIYTNKYATFRGMADTDKYKSKATAKPINDIDGEEYPQSRFFISHDVWENMSKNYPHDYSVAWRSLTSATNKRTMLATMLPLIPTCQSIQILQLEETREMLHVLSIFNSVIFDYIVRLKMVGLDLTQAIIKQIPVPEEEMFLKKYNFQGRLETIEMHINSRMKELYKSDIRLNNLFNNIDTYCLQERKSRKELISEIDCLVSILYSIDKKTLKAIANSFVKYYSSEEVANLF